MVFIELTSKVSGQKLLINVADISTITKAGDHACISMVGGEDQWFNITESYESIHDTLCSECSVLAVSAEVQA